METKTESLDKKRQNYDKKLTIFNERDICIFKNQFKKRKRSFLKYFSLIWEGSDFNLFRTCSYLASKQG